MNEIKNTTLIFPILHYRVPIRDGRPARWEPSPRGEGGSPPRPVKKKLPRPSQELTHFFGILLHLQA